MNYNDIFEIDASEQYYSEQFSESHESSQIADNDNDINEDEGDQDEQEYDENDYENQAEFLEPSRITNQIEMQCVLEEMNCTICYYVVQDVVSCSLCEAIYCRRCIAECYQWFSKSNIQICPSCRRDSQEYLYRHPFSLLDNGIIEFTKNKPSIITSKVPLLLKKLLAKIKLSCKNQEEGCQQILTYEGHQKHEALDCDYAHIECPNQGCNDYMKRKDLSDHILQCLYEKLACRFCNHIFPRNFYEKHINECVYRLKSCKWCHDKLFIYEMEDHEENCLLRERVCNICNQTFRQESFIKHTEVICLKQVLKKSQDNEKRLLMRIETLERDIKDIKMENIILQEDNILKQASVYNINSYKKKQTLQSTEQQRRLNNSYSLKFEDYDDDEQKESIEENIQEPTYFEINLNRQDLNVKQIEIKIEQATYSQTDDQGETQDDIMNILQKQDLI